jgi:anti-sigma regulatory factor (Ser/Thr protein kinase)
MISRGVPGYQFGVPPEPVSPIVGVSLRCDRRAPRLARRAVESALEAAPVLDDARLVTTELVNNAMLHSGCAADDIIRVMVQLERGFLIISVHDPGPWHEAPRRDRRDPSEPGGFALRIVDKLADRWGAEDPGGHRVWAALPLSKTQSTEPTAALDRAELSSVTRPSAGRCRQAACHRPPPGGPAAYRR